MGRGGLGPLGLIWGGTLLCSVWKVRASCGSSFIISSTIGHFLYYLLISNTLSFIYLLTLQLNKHKCWRYTLCQLRRSSKGQWAKANEDIKYFVIPLGNILQSVQSVLAEACYGYELLNVVHIYIYFCIDYSPSYIHSWHVLLWIEAHTCQLFVLLKLFLAYDGAHVAIKNWTHVSYFHMVCAKSRSREWWLDSYIPVFVPLSMMVRFL